MEACTALMQTKTRVASADDAYLNGISGAGDNRTIMGLDATSCTY
ncbi:hypothetical protein GGP85_001221 [Salinibacter ruber]|uniref:Uncharacterized protein n=1 Tax=Salinibacter ruber TaxID=146919 RepID=A0A9X2R1U6_9BACT|nr:hypothetical protein [Salinibacter ruber]MCS3678999.1 hypothetical protein [Salinibacter ruber]MCS3682141.1 hypothetical protein [Salinibacter ruber]MCS3825779.1 hypothetical protein [Salinibacter ruber]MCS4133436.1 hypothetical protein [Salinibacter ruber]